MTFDEQVAAVRSCVIPKQTKKRKAECTPEEWAANLEYRNQYDSSRQEEKRLASRMRRDRNPESARASVRRWRAANPDRARASSSASGKKWRESHKDACRLYRRNYQRKRRAECVAVRVRDFLASRLCHVLRRALGGSATKPATTMSLVGCSAEVLVAHLESKFQPGMSWENWGKGHGKWHIDHAVPFAAIDVSCERELRAVCHYTNLQPLWGSENLKKGGRCDASAVHALVFGGAA